jgi:hypothetical protein
MMHKYNVQKMARSFLGAAKKTTWTPAAKNLSAEPYIFDMLQDEQTENVVPLSSLITKQNKFIPTHECYKLVNSLRKDDVFPEELSQEEMINILFPKNAPELALSLSNVTAVFYGNMLQTIGNQIGMDNIDKVSKDFFYNLGKTLGKITINAMDGKCELPKDARGVTMALMTAIYKASPEYKFNVTHFDKDHSTIELKGDDRYLRVTKQLGFSDKLEWPVLHRFLEGASEELKANVDVKSEMLLAEDSGKCHERFTMKKRNVLA